MNRPNTPWRNLWDCAQATTIDVITHERYPIRVAKPLPMMFGVEFDPMDSIDMNLTIVYCGPAADLPSLPDPLGLA